MLVTLHHADHFVMGSSSPQESPEADLPVSKYPA